MTTTIHSRNNVGAPVSINLLGHRADYGAALELASSMCSRLPTSMEFIAALKDNDALFKQLKSEYGHFWLSDEPGYGPLGCCKINYEKCALEEILQAEWETLPINRRVYVRSGEGPTALGISDGYYLGRLTSDPHAEWRSAPLHVAVMDTGFERGRIALQRLRRGMPPISPKQR